MFDHIARIRGLASLAVVALLAVAVTGCSSVGAAAAYKESETASQGRNAAGSPFGGKDAQDLVETGSQLRNSGGAAAAYKESETASQGRNAAGSPFGGKDAQDLVETGSQLRNSATVAGPHE